MKKYCPYQTIYSTRKKQKESSHFLSELTLHLTQIVADTLKYFGKVRAPVQLFKDPIRSTYFRQLPKGKIDEMRLPTAPCEHGVRSKLNGALM